MLKISRGFTLIEIMIVVAIVAILTAIALPSYTAYVQRGKIVTAINQITSAQAAMEQFYQDNRTYVTTGVFVSPCDPANGLVYKISLKDWAFTCTTYAATTYNIQALGKTTGAVPLMEYWTDQSGAQSTQAVPSSWTSSTTAPQSCFLTKKGMTC